MFSGRREKFRGREPERTKGEKERRPPLRFACSPARSMKTNFTTSNYQRLRNAGKNDRRLKRSCSNDVHVIDGLSPQDCGDQITSARRTKRAFYASHSFLVEVQTKLATNVPCMRNSKLKIRTEGSSCRLQITGASAG